MEDALCAAKHLGEEKLPCDVYKLVKIYPFTDEFIKEISRYDVILFAEECVACGGIGEHLEAALYRSAAHLAQTIRETVKGETVS